MWRPQHDGLVRWVVATASAGLITALLALPAHAEPTSPSPTSTGTRTPTATPTPSATSTPSPTPTPTPTPTATPTQPPDPPPTEKPSDKPTDEPSEDPTASPTDAPPDPTVPPTDSPTDAPPDPTAPPTGKPTDTEDPHKQERQDPDDAYQEALLGAQTVAVAEAQRLLQQTLAAIDQADAILKESRAKVAAARAAEEEARTDLKIAGLIVERTQRQIDQIRTSTRGARAALGTVVREAYQNNGLSTLGVVLGADSPEDLSDRYVGMRTLLRASDTALGRLATDEADLRNALDTLEGQRKEKARLADAAAAKLTKVEAARDAAQDAQAKRAQRYEDYEHALMLAEEAALEDYKLYMELLDEGTAVGQYLNDLTTEDYGPGYGTGSFVLPAAGYVTSEYGNRVHPFLGYVKMHTGTDFAGGGSNIYAADSGTVVEATYKHAYGNVVIIDHGEFNGQRLSTLYAHQSGLRVSVGQRVGQGQVIGQIGSTGYSTGPHLHFEVRLDGQYTDPGPWLADASLP